MNYLFRPLLTTAIILLFSAISLAQVGRIQETTIDYEKSRVDALTVTLKPERKEVQKAFDDWMDDRYDIKMKGGGLFSDKNFESAEAVVIPAISSENITLMAMTEETSDGTEMTLFASRGLGNYVDKGDYQAFRGLEDVLDAFLSDYLPDYYEERVAEAREELDDLREDYSDAEKDHAKNEEKIRELREENEELTLEMNKLREQITTAEEVLDKRINVKRDVDRKMSPVRRN